MKIAKKLIKRIIYMTTLKTKKRLLQKSNPAIARKIIQNKDTQQDGKTSTKNKYWSYVLAYHFEALSFGLPLCYPHRSFPRIEEIEKANDVKELARNNAFQDVQKYYLDEVKHAITN